MPIRLIFTYLIIVHCYLAASVGQNLLAQKINFNCENCPPAEALVRLSQQTEINIAFNPDLLSDCPPIRLQIQNQPLAQVLTKILECKRLTFREFKEQIVVFKKPQKMRLAGFVTDAETGEHLLGAVVKILPEDKIGTTTNEFGFFSLQVEEGSYRLAFSYIGYETEQKSLEISTERTLRVALRPKTSLPEVVISAVSSPTDSARFTAGRKEIPIENLRKMTMPGGEADVVRLVALQPGVQTGVDGLGGLHVRGGNADQNLVLLDDVPVYNPSHALGLLSVFNSDIVSKADLWKGNFPARFGGRASSVLDIRSRDGNLKKYAGKVGFGMLASTLTLEGPVVRDTSAFVAAARFSYLDPWLKIFSKRKNLVTFPEKGTVEYRFYDVNMKLSKIYGAKDRLFLSFYTGKDNFQDLFQQQFFYSSGTFEERYSIGSTWGNLIAAARWNHLFNRRLFCNTTATFSHFFYENRIAFSSRFRFASGKQDILADVAQLYKTLIRDFSGKSDFTYFLTNRATLRGGGSFTRHFFQPGAVSVDLLEPGQTPSSLDSLERLFLDSEQRIATESGIYAEIDWRFWRGFQLMAGVHGSHFGIDRTNYFALQPRAHLQKNFKKGWAMWAGYHRMTQNLHQIGSFNVSLPFELWVPSTRKVRPEEVWQTTAGLSKSFRGGWSASVEGYWKVLDRVLTFLSAYDALFAGGAENASGWEDRIAAGRGWSRGGEFFLEKKSGRTTGSLAYTLSWTNRKFADLNSGQAFPFRFDRRHDLKILMQQKLSRRWSADATWVFATGNPITLSGVKFQHTSTDETSSRTVLVYTKINGYRLSNYHRLDVGATYFRQGKRLGHRLNLGFYNVYNRRNPFFLTVDAGSSVRGKATEYTLLPILPSFRYEISF